MHNKLNCYNIMYIKCDIFSQNHPNNYCCFSSWKISTICSGSSFVKIVCRAYVHAWMRCIGIINGIIIIAHPRPVAVTCLNSLHVFTVDKFFVLIDYCCQISTKQTMFGNSWLRITWEIWLFYCFEVGNIRHPFNREFLYSHKGKYQSMISCYIKHYWPTNEFGGQ